MTCLVKTCRYPRTKRKTGLCIGHDFLFCCQERRETQAEFVTRQEKQDMLRGKVLREEKAA